MKRLAIVILFVSGCSQDKAGDVASNRGRSESQAKQLNGAANAIAAADRPVLNVAARPEKIGVAYMDKNGTITLMLRTEDHRAIWEAQYTYRRTDKDYRQQLEEIGPLRPGESKEVFARPEDMSDSENPPPPSG